MNVEYIHKGVDHMLREKPTTRQGEYEVVLLEDLVPEDHLLRKIDKAVDFSFIHDLCKDIYIVLTMAVPPLSRSCCFGCCF